MKESELYCLASFVSFLSFLVCLYDLSRNRSINYQNTVIIILGLLSLSKSIEYYEKYLFKLTTNH